MNPHNGPHTRKGGVDKRPKSWRFGGLRKVPLIQGGSTTASHLTAQGVLASPNVRLALELNPGVWGGSSVVTLLGILPFDSSAS